MSGSWTMGNVNAWGLWEKAIREGTSVQRREALDAVAATFLKARASTREGGAVVTAGVSVSSPPESLKNTLISCLRDEDALVRSKAVSALVHWRDDDARGAVARMLADRDRGVRFEAIRVLPVIAGEAALPMLANVAGRADEDEVLRAYTLSAIEAVAAGTVSGQDPQIRVTVRGDAAVRCAGRRGSAVSPFRKQAAETLAQAFTRGASCGLEPFVVRARQALGL